MHTVRRLCVFLGMIITAPAWAGAGEPTGFDSFAFGTTRGALIAHPRFHDRCQSAPETETAVRVQGWRVTCAAYEVSDLGPMRVTFIFSAQDQLVSYVMYFARDRRTDVRTKVESLYGPPLRELEEGRTAMWRWTSGTHATLTASCRGLDGCLIVKAAEEKAAPVKR